MVRTETADITTQEDALRLVASSRALTQSLLARRTHPDPFETPRLNNVLSKLDQIEHAVRAGPWPVPRESLRWGDIGLYAVRELGEIDGGSLLNDLCPLSNLLAGGSRNGRGR